MLGSQASAAAGINIPGGQGSVAANLAAGTSAIRSSQYQQQANSQGSLGKAPYVFIGLVALYLVWAIIVNHQRIQESLRPANIAVNVHNFVNVGLMALLFIVSGKILFTKATAWGIPGAGWLGQIFAAG